MAVVVEIVLPTRVGKPATTTSKLRIVKSTTVLKAPTQTKRIGR